MSSEPCDSPISILDFSEHGKTAMVYAAGLWPGIYMGANDIHQAAVPEAVSEEYHCIKLNYCLNGRCELELSNGRYVYMSRGLLSLDSNQTQGGYRFPTQTYQGLEIILDLNTIENEILRMLMDFGIDTEMIQKDLQEADGSLISGTTEEWDRIAEETFRLLVGQNAEQAEVKILFIRLLYMLTRGHRRALQEKTFLTSGQRRIAMDAQRLLTEDISRHVRIEDLAKASCVSASSLKSYFAQLYGAPISEYMKNIRMQTAEKQILETDASIGEIASAVGYLNQSKFGAAFKEYSGLSPLEYRRMNKGRNEV